MRVDVNGVGIEFEVSGPDEGRPVVLLHGFPDSGRLWHNQVPPLADAGFRVIVPDLRGYGRSDKPAEVDAYNLLFLAGDVLGVLDAVGVVSRRGSPPAGEVVVHAAVPVPGRRRAVALERRLGELPSVFPPSRRRRSRRRARAWRVVDAGPQLVPSEHPARVLGRASQPAPAGAGADHGGVVERRLRAHRGPDDTLRETLRQLVPI